MTAISLEEATARLLDRTPVLEEETVPPLEALGRCLTRGVRSSIAQPPFDRSPLDGYALLAADTEQASPASPAVLRVVDRLYAGDTARIPLLPGQAARVMTGSMIPDGADCVIRQEDTDLGTSLVRVFKAASAGSNYCRAGEEYGMGAELLSPGRRIDAAAVALAASAGTTGLTVSRRPRVAILVTGDEVLPPGRPLPSGKVYDSVSAYLLARLRQFGAEVQAVCKLPP